MKPKLPVRHCTIVALLLALHFCLAVGSKFTACTATDELVHLAAGASYWEFNDYRLQPENGNLPQRWAAIPCALTKDIHLPPPSESQAGWETANAWQVGSHFFYKANHDHFPLLMAGRAMIALLSVATGLLVFFWSRSLFGDTAGFFSLILYCFSPDFLAHGALVTSDMCITLCFLLSLASYWRHLHSNSLFSLALSTLCFGLVWVSKYSAIILVPVLCILSLARAFNRRPLRIGSLHAKSRTGKFALLFLSGIIHGLVALLVIWSFYGFRFATQNPMLPTGEMLYPWNTLMRDLGFVGRIVQQAADWQLLPQSFLHGFAFVIQTTKVRHAFLDGDYSMTGWRTFFIYSFAYKTPAAFFAIAGLAAAMALNGLSHIRAEIWTRLRLDLYRYAPLLGFILVYGTTSILGTLNIGHRHIAPLYPALFILCGLVFSQRNARLLTISPMIKWSLLVLFCLESALSFPHYIAFYNTLCGGRDKGWTHLVDSSTDWGQDLPTLANYLTKRQSTEPHSQVYLSYFGSGSPEYYGIKATKLKGLRFFDAPELAPPLKPGLYCISATILQQCYGRFRGPWTREQETEYRNLCASESLIQEYREKGQAAAHLLEIAPKKTWEYALHHLDELRFARLCLYLKHRGPDKVLGGSILIFEVSALEIEQALYGPASLLGRSP